MAAGNLGPIVAGRRSRCAYESGSAHDDEAGSHTSLTDIAVGVVIGRSSEFFDFFVFAHRFGAGVPAGDLPLRRSARRATLWSFAIFALAFVARPFGTVIFMAIDRRYGRGIKLTMALFLLGSATAGIAFLPDYSLAGGYAIAILAVMRIAQGIALGGSWDGLASLLAMNAPQNAAAGTR